MSNSTSPPPNSPPSIVPTSSPTNSTPPAQTPPPPASAPPPQSSPPPVSAPPPSSPPSPPPAPPPSSPPPSPPPSPPAAPPPSTTSPPPPAPPVASPPPPQQSPPAPPPPTISPSPPPPTPDAPPPASSSPPPPDAKPPKHSRSPPPPPLTPPPSASPPTPLITIPPPPSPTASPPIALISPPPPPSNSSVNGSVIPTPAPSLPAEKPTARATQPGTNIITDGNPGGMPAGGAAAVGSIVGIFALSLLIFAVWYNNKRKKRKNRCSLNYEIPSPFASSQHSDSSFLRQGYSSQLAGSPSANNYAYSSDGGMGSSRSFFTYEELSVATDKFSTSKVLGEGGFGCVYKGVLVDGREVAVKQLKDGSGQGEREFRAEVEIISRIHHKHLVSLVGYCISDEQRLLVYDYVPNDTLHHHLHGNGTVMNWANRVKVAAGAARGLAYLHEDCQPRIIHRDIKSTNILLDNNFEARVADFGLAKLALELDLHTHVSTRVMGTFGYLAPEYASSGKLTEKSDVFSFGVVLLELITGRKPVDASQPFGDESLVEWARPLLNKALETEDFAGDLVDHRLEKNFIESEMFRVIEAAAACVRHSASKRPRMSQVVRALNSMEELADLNNGVKPGQSVIIDSREQSGQIRMFQRMAFGSQDYTSSEVFNSNTSWRTNL